MEPSEYARIYQEIQDIIVVFCESHGIDVHDPYELNAHKYDIWGVLVASGRLYPTMTFDTFNAALSTEMMREQVRDGFYEIFESIGVRAKPPTVTVLNEVSDVE